MKQFEEIDIYKVLQTVTIAGAKKNLVEDKNITKATVSGRQVVVDAVIDNPSLQAKKQMEAIIKKAIHKGVSEQADVKINVTTRTLSKEKPARVEPDKIPNIDNIIAIASGKGGVGKSTITANIAVSLVKMGFSVGVLDADVYGPSQHIMFDAPSARPLSVKVDGQSKIKPIECYGVKLLSLGFFTNSNQAVIWRGPMASKALNQLIFDAHWGKLDFLLIDLPPGTGDVHLSIVQALPISGAVIVSTPQNIALADAKKGVAMFEQENINVPVLGIIENMAFFTTEDLPGKKYYIFGKDGAKNLAQDIGTEFLGEIPLVQSIREASDFGHPVSLQQNTSLENTFYTITQNMVSQLIKRNINLPPTQAVRITTMSGCSAK